MHRKFIILIICCLLLNLSCETSLRDNERSLVTGFVLDQNGNPISNIDVISVSQDVILGRTTTTATGEFQFISLLTNRNNFTVVINPDGETSVYSSVNVNFLSQEIQRNYELGQLTISEKSKLNVSITKTSTEELSLRYSIDYVVSECNISIDPNISVELDNCSETRRFNGSNSINNPGADIEINSVLNTIAVFTYSIDDGEPQIIQIPLNQTEVTYDFEY